MIKIFDSLNPKDDIKRLHDIPDYFVNIFSKKFPHHSKSTLTLLATKCIYLRIRYLNELADSHKRKRDDAPNSARGLRKQCEYELG